MRKISLVVIITFILFIISILFFLYKTILGLGYLPFSDESGHIIGAVAINRGDILYRDYIDAHGPLVFIVTWLLGKCIGFSHIGLLRLVSTCFISVTGITVFFSPIFVYLWQRLLATSLWFFSIACVWIVQGLYLDSYWTIGGALTVIALASVILPMLYECNMSKTSSFVGGIAIGLLPFTAYPFSLLSAIFIFVIIGFSILKYRLHQTTLLMSFLGCLIAVLITFLWLFIYGDIGGMIAFHFIANQVWYARYVPLQPIEFFKSLTPGFEANNLIQDLAIYAFFLGAIFLFVSGRNKIIALVIALGVLTLDLRGSIVFHNGAFLIASLGMFSLSLIKITQNRFKLSIFLSGLMLIIMNIHITYAVSSPAIKTLSEQKEVKWELLKEKSEVEFVKEIHKYVKPDQRILVLPYSPDIFIDVNRLPMKKYHGYLPWEAEYAKHPWHGYDRDICIDLPKERPPVIYLNGDNVWGYLVKDYMACVIDFMNKEYSHIPNAASFSNGSYIYVRNDLLNK